MTSNEYQVGDEKMEKLERRTDLTGAGFERISAGLKKMKNLFLHHTHSLFFYRGFIYVVLGFLLGRAFILSEIMPFALPFFGSMLLIKRDKSMLACLALLGRSHDDITSKCIVCVCVADRIPSYVQGGFFHYQRPSENIAGCHCAVNADHQRSICLSRARCCAKLRLRHGGCRSRTCLHFDTDFPSKPADFYSQENQTLLKG